MEGGLLLVGGQINWDWASMGSPLGAFSAYK